MIRKTKFAFFEHSGQLELVGTFQAILPPHPPPAAMAAQRRAHSGVRKFLG